MSNQVDVIGMLKGLNLDVTPEQLGEGEYTFASNAVIAPGDLLSISTEGGTKTCINNLGYILGYEFIANKNLVVAFVVDENSTNSRIVKIDLQTCTSEILFQDPCLNFSIHNQIRTTYKQLDSCGEIVIVFVQRGNPIRYYNIDKPVTTCEDLALFTCSDDIGLKVKSVLDSGGSILSGKYWFLAGYSDEFGNVEAVTALSQEVSIIDDISTISWKYIDGCPANTPTTKSVELEFTNLLSTKQFLTLFIVSSIDFQYLIYKVVLRYNGTGTFNFTYSGGGTPTSIEEITIPTSKYISAELVTQHEDRLILGRLKNAAALDYQKQANEIQVKWFTSKISATAGKKCAPKLTNGILYPSAPGFTIRRLLTGFEVSYLNDVVTAGNIYNMINFAISQQILGMRFLDVTGFEYFSIDRVSNVTITSTPGGLGGNDMVRFDYDFATPPDEYPDCAQPWVTNTSFPPFTTRSLMTGGSTPLFYLIEEELTEAKGFSPYKDPLTSLYKTFMGNENYALSVWWEFCDGSFSPAYHIPGTTLEQVNSCFQGVKSYLVVGEDLEEIFYPHADSIVEANDINNPFKCEKFVWEIFDTSCIEEEPFELSEVEVDDCGNLLGNKIGVWQRGSLGYYEETCLQYPTATDCENDFIYPHTIDEDEVTMDNVRHHKIPSRRTTTHFKSNNELSVENGGNIADKYPYEEIEIYPIGLEFFNITPPINPPQPVVGYHIGFVKRTSSNSSVIGKGIVISSLYYSDEDTGNGYFFRESVNSDIDNAAIKIGEYGASVQGSTNYPNNYVPYKFFSPDTHFDKPQLNSSYIQVEQEWFGKGLKYAPGDVNTLVSRGLNINLEGQTVLPKLSDTASTSVNRSVVSQTYIGANENISGLSGLSGVVINFFGVSGVVVNIDTKTQDPEEGLLKYNNLCTSDIADGSSPISFSEFQEDIDCAKAHYVSLKRNYCNQYGDIYNLVYIPTGYSSSDIQQSSIKVFGDSFINYYSFFRTFIHSLSIAPALTLFMPSTTLIHGVYESNINVDLRHEGATELGEVYYPKLSNDFWGLHSSISTNPPERCLLEQFRLNTENSENDLDAYGIDNVANYNKDYSRQPDFLPQFAPSSTFKPCDCDSTLINDIAVSLVHNEVSDGWRIFRPANIFTIPRNTGEIMNLFSYKNTMFAHTTDNLWRIFTTQDRLLTDTSTVFIGSGSIFTQTPQYLYSTREGYAGIQQMNGWYLNSNGYFWIDLKSKKVFVLSEGLEELSLKKMFKWFRKNLKLHMDFPGFLGKDNYANPFSGTGWHIAFDYSLNRLLVTNRDFAFKEPSRFGGIYSEVDCEQDKIYYEQVTKKFVLVVDASDCAYTIIDFTDEEYFCNKSWTLSLSFLTGYWVSWHSYVPTAYLTTLEELYSLSDKQFVTHNADDLFTTYYGNYYPYIIEMVTKKQITASSIWESLSYLTESKKLVNGRYKDTGDTYTHIIAWHENDIQQNTGKLEIMPRIDDAQNFMVDSITDFTGIVKAHKRHGNWFINGLYNYIDDQELSVWSEECVPLGLDKEIIQGNINFLKDYQYLDRLRNNFLTLRFIFDNPSKSDIKLLTKFLISITAS
ncbi:MAG TPA: hypothetical protein PKD00_00450 [Burkholderiales bacterium]|nr:hypothetical protein [Burkholderiales bacterium]